MITLAVIVAIFIASNIYIQRRGKVRHKLARQFADHSAFMAPINCLFYLFSAVPNRPYLDPTGFDSLTRLNADWEKIRDEAKTIFSGSLNYKKDNFYVGAAYETLSKGFAMADGPDGSLYGNSSKGLRLGAKYEFSKVGLTALYQNLADYNQSSFAVDEETGDVTTANDLQATTYGGEIRFKFAAKFAAKAGYYFTDPDTDTDDDEYQMFAIGVDHKYAKDLWFYLQYATVLNGDTTNASLGSKDNGHGKIVVPAAPGKNPSGISLGIAKKF